MVYCEKSILSFQCAVTGRAPPRQTDLNPAVNAVQSLIAVKSASAAILSEPEDGGPGRLYRVEDLEGHRWMFLQRSKR